MREKPAHNRDAARREPRKEFGVNLALPSVRLQKQAGMFLGNMVGFARENRSQRVGNDDGTGTARVVCRRKDAIRVQRGRYEGHPLRKKYFLQNEPKFIHAGLGFVKNEAKNEPKFVGVNTRE
jgi:hypothetical protein